jgi:hypothetical protein
VLSIDAERIIFQKFKTSATYGIAIPPFAENKIKLLFELEVENLMNNNVKGLSAYAIKSAIEL